MKFRLELTDIEEKQRLTIHLPESGEPITSVDFEGSPNVGEIRAALKQQCELGGTACGASVDLRATPKVYCSATRCPFQPSHQKV